MFFKNYFNGLAEVLDVKYKSHLRDEINPADLGELCELFLKEFLFACLDNHYQVFRGGNIVNTIGDRSPQLDIILTNRNTLRIFSDKGIYPIETICGAFCITSNLTTAKLKHEIAQLGKIPKHHYDFNIEKAYGKEFNEATHNVWRNLVPYTCIFGFNGEITETWIEVLNQEVSKIPDSSLWPSIIIVNKKGMIEKAIDRTKGPGFIWKYVFTPIVPNNNYGEWCSKILFNLYNLSSEQNYMRPDYANYFSKDYGLLRP